MTGHTHDDDRLEDLPPSALYVLHVVEDEAPLTRQELLEQLGMHERTVDRALDTLREQELVAQTRDTEDLRRVVVQTDGGPNV